LIRPGEHKRHAGIVLRDRSESFNREITSFLWMETSKKQKRLAVAQLRKSFEKQSLNRTRSCKRRINAKRRNLFVGTI